MISLQCCELGGGGVGEREVLEGFGLGLGVFRFEVRKGCFPRHVMRMLRGWM